MDGNAQDIRIVPVNILRAVAVMAVRIDHGNSFNSELMADVFNHHGFNIDVAESPRAVGDQHGMMAGRPDQGKGVVHVAR